MRRYLAPTVALTAVIVTGVVHGFYTDRWHVNEKVQHAAASMDGFPIEFGDWAGENLTPRGRDDQGLPGQLYRRYTNRKTGDVISVALVCGRPGPVSIHTPDVCYGASGFKVGKRIEFELKDLGVSGPAPRFYSADMSKTSASEEVKQRLYWTWRADGRWQVAESPRLSFARQPVLFKFYIARDLTGLVPVSEDPCVGFLKQLLPELEGRLVDS